MPAGRWLLALAALAVAAAAFAERMLRLPAPPFADADAWGYIGPAVLLFTEGEYVHVASRGFVYPAFVHGALRVFGSWSAVAVLQHLLGVAGGLLLLAAWMRVPLPAAASPALCAGRGLLGLGLLAAHLFLAQTMVFEHHLRPEAVSQVVMAGMLFAVAGLIRIRPEDPRRGARFAAEATLLLGSGALLVALRPQTLLVLPAALGGLAVAGVWLRPGRRAVAAALGLPLLLAGLGLWLPGRLLADENPRGGRFSAGVLFFWHFHLVEEGLREDLQAGDLPPARADTVGALLDAYAAERRRHDREGHKYRNQGYNPDRLFYGEAGRLLSAHFGEDGEEYTRFALGHFARAVATRPLGYARKVLHHLVRPYAWPEGLVLNPRSYFKGPFLLARSRANLARAEGSLRAHPPSRRYLEALAAAEPPDDDQGPRRWLFGSERRARAVARLYEGLGLLHTPLLLLTLALLPFRGGRGEGAFAAFALGAAGLAFACHLTAASVHGLEEPRYVLSIAVLPLATTFAAGLFVSLRSASLGRRLVRPRARTAPGSPGGAPESG